MKETPLVVKNEDGKACLNDDKQNIKCLNWVSNQKRMKISVLSKL